MMKTPTGIPCSAKAFTAASRRFGVGAFGSSCRANRGFTVVIVMLTCTLPCFWICLRTSISRITRSDFVVIESATPGRIAKTSSRLRVVKKRRSAGW